MLMYRTKLYNSSKKATRAFVEPDFTCKQKYQLFLSNVKQTKGLSRSLHINSQHGVRARKKYPQFFGTRVLENLRNYIVKFIYLFIQFKQSMLKGTKTLINQTYPIILPAIHNVKLIILLYQLYNRPTHISIVTYILCQTNHRKTYRQGRSPQKRTAPLSHCA